MQPMPTLWRQGDLHWIEAWPGVEVADLHRHEGGGGAAFFRLRPGSKIPEHIHVAGEHTYVIEGRLRFGETELGPGDALWTHPGEQHEVQALTTALFLGVAPPKRPSP